MQGHLSTKTLKKFFIICWIDIKEYYKNTCKLKEIKTKEYLYSNHPF